MKALTFFSNFKNKSSNDTELAVDISALQNSVLTRRNGKKIDTKVDKAKQTKVQTKPSKTISEKSSQTTEKPTQKVNIERSSKATDRPSDLTETTTKSIAMYLSKAKKVNLDRD